MKHAFSGIDDGMVSVSLTLKDDAAALVIEDNGVGMPYFNNFKNSSGFGMQLVDMLTMQLEGDIRIEHGHGTKVILGFKI